LTRVVLPAPFGPRRPKTVPLLDGEVDAVERSGAAEPLGQAADFYRCRHVRHGAGAG
jgi:hypothetical protein